MSLEDAVAANTAAMQALTAAILSKNPQQTQAALTPPLPAAPLGAAVPGGPARPGSPLAAGPAKPRGRPPSAAAAVAALPPAGPAIPGQPAVQAAVPLMQHAGYEAVAASIQQVCEALGNKVGVSILAQFNVTHGRQLTAEQYPLVVQMCNEALAGAAQGTLA